MCVCLQGAYQEEPPSTAPGLQTHFPITHLYVTVMPTVGILTPIKYGKASSSHGYYYAWGSMITTPETDGNNFWASTLLQCEQNSSHQASTNEKRRNIYIYIYMAHQPHESRGLSAHWSNTMVDSYLLLMIHGPWCPNVEHDQRWTLILTLHHNPNNQPQRPGTTCMGRAQLGAATRRLHEKIYILRLHNSEPPPDQNVQTTFWIQNTSSTFR